jgi:hypothetical protein
MVLLDPRVEEGGLVTFTITIGICTIAIIPDTCKDLALQDKIGFVFNGDNSGTTQEMAYDESHPTTAKGKTNQMGDVYQKTLLNSHRN